ncbi:MAG: DUF302 domain-containing protein [Desulfobaccales bacterium]
MATASPTLAIDFPLQALAWEDAHGKVWLTYNAPEYLKERDGPRGIAEEHAGIAELVKKAIE